MVHGGPWSWRGHHASAKNQFLQTIMHRSRRWSPPTTSSTCMPAGLEAYSAAYVAWSAPLLAGKPFIVKHIFGGFVFVWQLAFISSVSIVWRDVLPAYGQASQHGLLFFILSALHLAAFWSSSLQDPGVVENLTPTPTPTPASTSTECGGAHDDEAPLVALHPALTAAKPARCIFSGVAMPLRSSSVNMPPCPWAHRRCVARFDHYCPFLNNAVGWNNQVSFFIFLVLAVAHGLQAILLSWFAGPIAGQISNPLAWKWSVFFTAGIASLSVGFAAQQLRIQFRNIRVNVTAHERARGKRLTYFRTCTGGSANPFNRGFAHNWAEFMKLGGTDWGPSCPVYSVMDFKGHSIREAVHLIVDMGLGDDLVTGKGSLQQLSVRAAALRDERSATKRGVIER